MNAADETPLEALVDRSRRGDLDAFSLLVRRLHGEVRGFLAMLAVAPDWIDDVAQEVFIEVYRSLDKVEADRPFGKWVRGVARNVVRRHGERQSRESKLRQDAVSVYLRRRREEVEAAAPGEPAGTSLDALKHCLERVPDHLRRLLDLHYAEQLTSAAIAQVVNRSADAVRMSLMRTRTLLLDCIQSRREGAVS